MVMEVPKPGTGGGSAPLIETGEPGGKPARKPRTTRVNPKVQDVRSADLANTGKLLPMAPTTAEDLVEQWEIPEADCYHVRVNVFRQKMGDEALELLDSVPVLEYDLQKVAGQYGPGRYFIKGTPRKYAFNSARFDVSEELARRNGFGRLPQRAADITAARTLQDATKGPVDPVDLLAAVEVMLDRKLKEQGMGGQIIANPMQTMEKQMEAFYGFMGFMDKMENRAIQLAERRVGLRNPDEPVEPASTTLQIIQALAPAVGPVLERILSGPPAARPAVVHQPAALATHQPAPAAPANPQGGIPVQTIQKPELTEEERATVAPAVSMLRPFAPMLANAIKKPIPDAQLAEELGGYIPPNLYTPVIALAALVRNKGVGVLAYIHDDLTDPRWPAVLSELAAMLAQIQDQEG